MDAISGLHVSRFMGLVWAYDGVVWEIIEYEWEVWGAFIVTGAWLPNHSVRGQVTACEL